MRIMYSLFTKNINIVKQGIVSGCMLFFKTRDGATKDVCFLLITSNDLFMHSAIFILSQHTLPSRILTQGNYENEVGVVY